MSIKVIRHTSKEGILFSLDIQVDDVHSVEAFKELVHRATNLWPDASPEIKMFADEITNNDDGKHMQDYTKPTVTNQPKFCSTLLTQCRSGCKGSTCKIKQLTQSS